LIFIRKRTENLGPLKNNGLGKEIGFSSRREECERRRCLRTGDCGMNDGIGLITPWTNMEDTRW